MKFLELQYNNEIEISELKKIISFVSSDIQGFDLNDSCIKLYLTESADKAVVKDKYEKLLNKYCDTKKNEEFYFRNKPINNNNFINLEKIMDNGLVKRYGDGLIGLHEEAILLFEFFDYNFRRFALEEDAEEKMYPTLLDASIYQKTGYLRSSPQYAIFCCDVIEDVDCIERLNDEFDKKNTKEVLSEPQFALSPSACFHTYMEYRDKKLSTNKMVTFVQKVFRNEGRFNWDEFGRLRDYHVREIVFLGSDTYVEEERIKIMEKTAKFIEKLGISGEIISSSDPFITPNMQRFKKLQIYKKNKYEARINIEKNKSIACASFNLHGVSFTNPFNIQIQGTECSVTGCVGFGIERWVLAFLSQYGVHKENWPGFVIEFIKDRK